MFQAYLITCLINNRQYIGITSRGLRHRWSEHVYDSKARNKKMAISRAIAKYGAENFRMDALCSARSWEDICAVEPILIIQWSQSDGRDKNVEGELVSAADGTEDKIMTWTALNDISAVTWIVCLVTSVSFVFYALKRWG